MMARAADFLLALAVVVVIVLVFAVGFVIFIIAIPLILAGIASLLGGDELAQSVVALCYYILAGLYFSPHLFESNRRRKFYIHL